MTDGRKEKIKLETELLRYLVLVGLTIDGGTPGFEDSSRLRFTHSTPRRCFES